MLFRMFAFLLSLTFTQMVFAQDEAVRPKPKPVKALQVSDSNGAAVLSWRSDGSEADYFSVLVKTGLDNYKELETNYSGVSLTLPQLTEGLEYAFMVIARQTNDRKSKGVEVQYYRDVPAAVLPDNAGVKGKISGIGKGPLLAVFHPLYLGAFGNYDCSPRTVLCSADGSFTAKLPAGVWTLESFEDLNRDGSWTGDWLGKTPENRALLKNVVLAAGKETNLGSITLTAPNLGLPEPVYEEMPALTNLYQAAWNFAREKITAGKTNNGFVNAYMDEGFNNHIYQWDTCFMMQFGMYGGSEFPAMASIDNFYAKQRKSGYICRVQNEDTGKDYNPSKNDPSVNPPLYAWTELRYLRLTGDPSRVLRALSHNHRYFRWLKNNTRTKEGFYYTSNLGSGMDNSPREGKAYGWIDATAQMALFARCMAELSDYAGVKDLAKEYRAEFTALGSLINEKMWDEKTGLYYDVKKDGSLHLKKTIASFWPLLAGIVPADRAEKLVNHLKNPSEFFTQHLFPTLSKDEPEYDKKGYYWRGAVWAPTDFAVVKGLEKFGFGDFAREASRNHISNMSEVYENFVPAKKKLPIKNPNIAWPEELDGSKQIWELYSSELPEPGTRWDNQFYGRPKFVGWSGAGPITLLIENVIGIRADALAGKITWNLASEKPCGVRNLTFNGGRTDLLVTNFSGSKPQLSVKTDRPFTLELVYQGKTNVTKY